MPRIKSITTGSIPSFVDLILNIDEGDTSSSLAAQDTWLAQLKAKDAGKLLMYGDDTWLKLFPDTFDRVDGTSSFFVSVCPLECEGSAHLVTTLRRISPRSTTMLPGMSQVSSRIMTGASWSCIT